MAKKILLLVNPVSGKTAAKTHLLGIVKEFCDAGHSVTVHITQRRADATAKVIEEGFSYDIIVACGGDGTFNEVVTGAVRSQFEGALGFLPCGTTNDLANTLSLPKKLVQAGALIANTEPKELDIGSFNRTRYFTYIATFGAFTDVAYSTDQKLKNVLGHAAYVTEAIGRLVDLRSYRVRVDCDGEIYEDDFLFGAAANSFSIGGVMKLKKDQVSLNDGYHDVLLIRNPKNAIDLANLSKELLSGNFTNKSVLFFHGKKIAFDCEEEIPWCVDGEFAGNHSHAVVRNLKNRIRIFYP